MIYVRVTKVVRNKRLLIAEHEFKSEKAARDYLSCYQARHGYEVKLVGNGAGTVDGMKMMRTSG